MPRALQPVFRFAPSPNGLLHLGHAYSALLNARLARESGGRFLLRIEDIDAVRCRPALIEAALEDLAWLGLAWEEPVLRQSSRGAAYAAALGRLAAMGLLYRCRCSRRDIAVAVFDHERRGERWPRDPDGAPLHARDCGAHSPAIAEASAQGSPKASLRLDMVSAIAAAGADLDWREHGVGRVAARPERWGDIILARKDIGTSYHLAVVVDDAFQGVSEVVRGRDLYEATAIHRLLQRLLSLPEPAYRHHPLILDEDGQKLAKSRVSTPIRQLRAEGVGAAEIRARLGFS